MMRGALTFARQSHEPVLRGRAGVESLRRLSRLALADAARRVGIRLPELDATPLGAPRVSNGWHVSLTHTRGLAAAAISKSPLGVDAEWIGRPRLRAARESASVAELSLIGAEAEPSPEVLVQLWTGREAVLKKLGLGLTGFSRCKLVEVCDPGQLVFECDGHRHRVSTRRIGDAWLSICAAEPLEPTELTSEGLRA